MKNLTTYEMDGLFSEEDIKNRYSVVFQCFDCKKWTRHNDWLPAQRNTHRPCSNCGGTHYDPTSIKSWRTYNPETDNKRRPKVTKKK